MNVDRLLDARLATLRSLLAELRDEARHRNRLAESLTASLEDRSREIREELMLPVPRTNHDMAALQTRLDHLLVETIRQRTAAWSDFATLSAEARRWRREYEDMLGKLSMIKSLGYQR